MYEYLTDRHAVGHPERAPHARVEGSPGIEAGAGDRSRRSGSDRSTAGPPIDRTPKLYIGGKQVRPDSAYALPVRAADGRIVAEVGRGNRKDIRNAVEAAHKAQPAWARASAYARSQVLYFLAENLAVREAEFAERLRLLQGADGLPEVQAAIARCFTWAAWADKYDGAVHHTPMRSVTLAMPEALGVVGVVCPDEAPLLSLVSLVLPAIAMGNAVVAVPSEAVPLLATDLYQVLETSDVPGGIVNLVTGLRSELLAPLAGHDDVDAIWVHATQAEAGEAERLSTGNMKRTWTDWRVRDWQDGGAGEGTAFLRHATQVKNIWVPYGA
jgi:aldehyde dehydrogenase (NAD+)